MGEETKVQNMIRTELSNGPTRLWRNNVGRAYYARSDKGRAMLAGGVRSGDLSRVQHGLCVGSSDLVGYHTVKVTPDMVGQEIAVFVGLETKSSRGKPTAAQSKWLRLVGDAGGLAGAVRTLTEAAGVLARTGSLPARPSMGRRRRGMDS